MSHPNDSMAVPDTEHRHCVECLVSHSHQKSAPCDDCKGALCWKCCHEKNLVYKAMD